MAVKNQDGPRQVIFLAPGDPTSGVPRVVACGWQGREEREKKTRANKTGTGETGRVMGDVSLTKKTQTRATANDEWKNIVGSVDVASGRKRRRRRRRDIESGRQKRKRGGGGLDWDWTGQDKTGEARAR
jgi:hypothetical protein